jgi:CxxC-x17-CxxC domain-containing protein
MGNFGGDNRGGGRNFGRRSFGGGGDRSRGGFGGGYDRSEGRREMFSTTCSDCGKDCQVPFRPSNGKPVYCSECFEKINGGRNDSRRPERGDFRSPAPSFDQNKGQFEAINAKLDKILNILAPTPAPVVKVEIAKDPEPVEKIADKIDLTKVKKAVKKVASKKK